MLAISNETIVTWTNNDTIDHMITSWNPEGNHTGLDFESAFMYPGDIFRHIFLSAGTYYFFDRSPQIFGKIIVSNNSTVGNKSSSGSAEQGNETNSQNLADIANKLVQSGNNQEAIKYYYKILAINPNDVDTLLSKASAFETIENETGNYTDAIRTYDRV